MFAEMNNGCPGLVVMGRDSLLNGCEFKIPPYTIAFGETAKPTWVQWIPCYTFVNNDQSCKLKLMT